MNSSLRLTNNPGSASFLAPLRILLLGSFSGGAFLRPILNPILNLILNLILKLIFSLIFSLILRLNFHLTFRLIFSQTFQQAVGSFTAQALAPGKRALGVKN